MAGLSSVPVQVIDASDSAALEIALVENPQREDSLLWRWRVR